ncbi:MAG: DASH family cryptochrome [Cyanobacteria bacterium P01_H01_bin.74]
MSRCFLYWFRNDLRLADNRALTACIAALDAAHDFLLPVYCMDPRQFAMLDLGFPKTGVHRRQFLEDCLRDLQQRLQSKGSDLLIVEGKPEVVLPILVTMLNAVAIYGSKQMTREEVTVEQALENTLQNGLAPHSCDLHLTAQMPLIEKDHLPFSIENLPDVFTQFRKRVEKNWQVLQPQQEPTRFPAFPQSLSFQALMSTPESSESQALESHTSESQALEPGIKPVEIPDSRPALPLTYPGGESEAHKRLQHYFWETHGIQTYKETRNGLLGDDYSSKFSPYLVLGCLSARQIDAELCTYEARVLKNESTYWLRFELLWRDYFYFVFMKYGNRLFQANGLSKTPVPWKKDQAVFQAWCRGETGIPFVDANMKALNATGFMSNRGRQNVASFLSKTLKIDWRWGAAYFESLLIDYEVCSNWGNWAYIAGVGNDPRENRVFNVVGQGKRYDSNGAFIQHWLPELAGLPAHLVHTPWKLNPLEAGLFNLSLPAHYKSPLAVQSLQ